MHGPGHHGGHHGHHGGHHGHHGGYHGHHGHYGHYGYHRPHHGFYGGRRRRSNNYVRRSPSDGSMWQEFKSTMSYSLKKHSVFGLATGLLSFVLINPIQDMTYTYRKNALKYSKDKKRITDEQYKLRMIKLEESNCAHMLRNGMIDQEQYDSMMDSFEQQYGIEEKHKVK
jgi:hypothetical protein